MKDLSTEQLKDPKRRAFMAAGAIGSVALAGSTLVTPVAAQSEVEMANPLGVSTDEVDISTLPRIQQKLVPPPYAPEHDQVATGGPKNR